MLPGVASPPLASELMMAFAGAAWGVYTLRGKRAPDALATTAGNFVRASVFALAVSAVRYRSGAVALDSGTVPLFGALSALASGALASGGGYAVWYSVLPRLTATHAATLQLSVPILAALGAVAFLAEPWTLRLALAACATLGGVALTLRRPKRGTTERPAPPDLV